MKNEVNRAPWAKKKTFLFILALCAASAVWGTTVTKTAKTIASEQGWETKEAYTEFALDDVITCTTYGTNGYYSADSPNDWRIYQSRENGKFVISAKEGYIIKSITLTYGKRYETDIVARNCGINIIEANRLVSGQSYAINATSVTLFSANTSTATKAQARISQFSVVYEPICAIEEAFTNVIQTGAAGANTKWEGDYAEWNVTSVRRAGTDTLAMGIQGTWSNNDKSSAFLQTTNAEGGVKHISFIWRQWGVENGATLKMNVQVGSTFDKTSQTTGVSAAAAAPFMLFDEEVGCKENAQIKITNTSVKNTKTGRTTFRDLIITPYLRYTYTETKQVYDDESTFDCSLQIDNTDGEGAITYSSDNTNVVSFADPANPEATIVGGGEATITATWSEGASTSFKLKVNVLPVPTVTFPGITDGKKSVALDVESFTEAATVDMTVPVVYSSSETNVAIVDNNGKVTVLTTGTTDITAKVEAKKGEYKEASATYTLTVTASEASENSFVEKYGKTGTWTNYTDGNKITGTDNIFYWVANNTRRQSGDKIGSNVGLRFRNTLTEGYHLLPDPEHNEGIMEGGIKRIAFTYKEAEGGSGVNLEISAGEVSRSINTKPNSGVELPFAANFFVKENTSLKMYNTKGASVVTIGPISIVPYLLFTTKSDEAFLSLVDKYDVKDVLINNTDDGEVVYSILTADAQSQISNEGVVDFTNVTKSETITIQAAWTPDGKSSATVITTMTLYVDAEYETDKTVKEKFSNYGETGWTTSEPNEATKNGDVYDWRTKLTRHNTADTLVDNQQAIWFAQGGYVATADATDNTKVGPAEGGIKRIAFDWNQNGVNQTGDDLYISVSVDGTEMSAIRRDGGEQPTEPWQYIHNLNVKKNATLKIENKSTTSKSEGGRVKIGTIVITPYLLYTTKEVSKMFNEGSYINTGLTNNIKESDGGTLTFTSSDEAVATIDTDDETHKDKVVFVAAGDVTITANWTPDGEEEPAITTSYLLHITEKADRGLSFQYAVKETTVGGSDVTNTLNGTFDGTAQTWSTASEGAITSVDNVGLVSAVAIGTDTVTVVVAESDAYQEGTASYKVIVRTGVADDNKLVESFSGISKDASTSETEWKGDLQNYFSWKVKSTRHNGTGGDTIGGAGVAGTVLFAKGQIATDDVIEGGIKYFTFNWKQPYVEAGATLRLTLEAGEESYQQDYVVATDNGSTTHEHLYFAGDMQVKKNVQLILKNESFKTDGGTALTENGRIAIDKFEIVPYLFYTTKSHTIENATEGATYTNTDLINNIDEGAITYSLIGEGADDIASIDTDGKVTVKTGGVVTVQAKWVPDATNEEEFVTTTYTLTINFPAPDVEFIAPEEVALNGTIGENDMNVTVTLGGQPVVSPSITYTSSNENVIKITNNGWQIIGIGKTTITATVKGTPTYGQVAKTADIKVTNITPAEGTYWKETFSSLGTNSGYDITLTTIEGDNNVLKWKTRNFERNASTDKIKGEQGIRLNNDKKDSYNNPGYVEYFTEGDVTSQEGGIKRVQFQWRIPGDQDNKKVVFDVKYKEGDQTVVRTLTYNGIAHATVYDYAQNFNLKNNNKLTIAGSKTSESPVIIGPITITPYLLYTKKVVEVTYDLEGENTVDATANLINNIDEGTVTYSLSAEAQATIDGSTITLANADETITVTATWGEVSTTFTLKVTAAAIDELTLLDTKDNSEVIKDNKGDTLDVIIKRGFTAGTYNTLCLPFDITKEKLATALGPDREIVSLAQYAEATLDDATKNLNIKIEETDEIEAGTPYLLQFSGENISADDGITFEDVEIVNTTGNAVGEKTGTQFIGGINPTDISAEDKSILFVVAGNKLAWNATEENSQLKGFRAYFNVPGMTPASGVAPRLVMRSPHTPTGWNALKVNENVRKIMLNNQLLIIRSGRVFNAQGQMLK